MTSEPKRVLITGGSGFLGTNVVQGYLDRGVTVLSLDKAEPRNAAHRGVFQRVDILDEAALKRAFQDFGPDLLIHFAARTDLEGLSLGDYRENIDGVRNVTREANECRSLRRAIYASSRLVFQIDHTPAHDYDYSATTFYGKSKIEGERIVREQETPHVPWVLVRPTSIWGPWFDVPYKGFFVSVEKGRYRHPRGRQILKSFGYVGNLVHELMRLAEAPEQAVAGRVFFLADYEPIDVRQWSRTIARHLGVPDVREMPYALMKLAAVAGDLLEASRLVKPPITSWRLNNLVTNMVYPLSPTAQVAGALPFAVDEGVARTVAWMRGKAKS